MMARSASGACSRFSGLKARRGERVVDGAQAVGPLGMAVARIVLEAGGVGEEQRGHRPDMVTRSRFGRVTLA